MGALIFVPALVASAVFGFVFSIFAAQHYLTVLQSTGSGAKQVTWPSEPFIDNFWKVFYLGWLIGLWLGPAWFLGRAFATGSELPWMRYAVPLSVFWICYPISQLSSLSGPSIWLPFHHDVIGRLARKPDVLIGFSDAGAHLRNMAHYSFPLRMLRLARDAEKRGEPFMKVERAVHRLTGEIGAWLGLDVGTLTVGKAADLVVVDPERLGPELDIVHEAPPLACLGGVSRLVNEGGGAVRHVLVSGRAAVWEGAISPDLGSRKGLGRVLRAL